MDTPPSALTDRALFEAMAGGAPPDAGLEGELRRRLADPVRRPVLRALLESYAGAAPEYVDEAIQALARHYLAQVDARRLVHDLPAAGARRRRETR